MSTAPPIPATLPISLSSPPYQGTEVFEFVVQLISLGWPYPVTSTYTSNVAYLTSVFQRAAGLPQQIGILDDYTWVAAWVNDVVYPGPNPYPPRPVGPPSPPPPVVIKALAGVATVSVTATNAIVMSDNAVAGVAEVMVETYAPTVSAEIVGVAETADVAVSANDATAESSSFITVVPGTGNVVVRGLVVTITVSEDANVTAQNANVVVTANAPTVSGGVNTIAESANVAVIGLAPQGQISPFAPAGVANVTINAPHISAQIPGSATAGRANVGVTAYTANVGGDANVTAGSANVSAASYGISGSTSQNVNPTAGSANVGVVGLTPTVHASAVVLPGTGNVAVAGRLATTTSSPFAPAETGGVIAAAYIPVVFPSDNVIAGVANVVVTTQSSGVGDVKAQTGESNVELVALAPTFNVRAAAGKANVAAAALQPTIHITPAVGKSNVTVVANQISSSPSTNVTAGHAAVTVAAYEPSLGPTPLFSTTFSVPLPDDAPLDSNSSTIISNLLDVFTYIDAICGGIGDGNGGYSVFVVDDSTPLVDVSRLTDGSSFAWQPTQLRIPAAAAASRPLSSDGQPANDWTLFVTDGSSWVAEMWQACPNDDTTPTAWVYSNLGYWQTSYGDPLTTWDGVFINPGTGLPDGSGEAGSGLAYLGLLPKQLEVQNGVIPHMIAAQTNSPPGYSNDNAGRSPGTRSDLPNNSSWAQYIQEGMVLRFPTSASMPGGMEPLAQMVWQAIQTYGMIITDRTGGQTLGIPCQGSEGQDTDYITDALGSAEPYNVFDDFDLSELVVLDVPSSWPPGW
jgi:hypothetical protein